MSTAYITRLTEDLGIDFAQQEISIRDLLTIRCKKHPDKTFAIYPDEDNYHETYQALYQSCINVAGYLHSKGLEKGSKVAFLIQNGSDAVHVLLGIMLGGFVAVPIKDFWHEKQIVDIVAHSDAEMFIISSYYEERFANLRLALGEDIDVVNCGQVQKTVSIAELPCLSAQDEALLIYTSGTTSNSKGVLHLHRALARPFNVTCDLKEDDIALCVLPLYNKNAMTVNLLTTIVNGSLLVMPTRFRLKEFWKWVTDFKCTWFALVPAIVTQLLYDKSDVPTLPHVRFARCSSAALANTHHVEFEEKFAIPLLEAMGSTETGGIFCNFLPPKNKVGSPGVPNFCEVRVVDDAGKDVPQGEVGEFMVCSRGNMKGYYKNPELTARVKKGEWCYTGDLGYVDDEGYFCVVGRKKDIIIKGGQNIFPKEIEEVLLRHVAVRDVAVIGKDDELLGEDVVAYVILHQLCTVQELQQFCTQHLTALQIPCQIHIVDEFPRNSNGKVQKWRFNEISVLPQVSTKSIPKDKVQAVADIWSKFFHGDIDIDANFFELGGNSLELAHILNEVRLAFGVEISLAKVFQSLSIRGMANCFSESDTLERIVPIQQHSYPLSYHQQQQWLLEKLNPQRSLYNKPHVYEISGTLDVQVLEQSFHLLIERHQVLRTNIVMENDVPRQIVFERKFTVNRHDFCDRDEVTLQQHMQQQIEKSFDLEHDFMLRVDLYHIAQNKFILLIVNHHIATDRYAMTIFFSELKEIYAATLRGETPCLEHLSIQYKDYACWQQSQQEEKWDLQLCYWKKKLQNYEKLQLAMDFSGSKNFAGTTETFVVPSEVFQRLQAIAHEQRTSLFILLHAVFHLFLSRYSQQRDIVTGFTTAGRHHPQLEHLIGYFINTLVLRSCVEPEVCFNEYLAAVNRNSLEAYQNQHVPFEKILEQIERGQDRYDNPIFNVMFAVNEKQNIFELQLHNCSVAKRKSHSPLRFPLALSLFHERSTLHGEFRYRIDSFTKETIQGMVEHFLQLLQNIADNPQQKIYRIPMLSKKEIESLIVADDAKYTPQTNVVSILEKIAARFGSKTALIFEENNCTYEQLWERIEHTTQYILQQNVHVGNKVIVYMSPSIDFIIAMYAVLRAGATVIPVSSDFPLTRMMQILDDDTFIFTQSSGEYLQKCKVLTMQEASRDKTTKKILPTLYLDMAACIIYTSGSTGIANGVVLTHGNLASKIDTITKSLSLTEQDIFALTGSIAFVTALRQVFVPLSLGATLLVVAVQDVRDPEKLFQLLSQHKATSVDLVPSSYCKTCAQVLSKAKYKSLLASCRIRQIITSGEKLACDTPQIWRNLLPNTRFFNAYGQTETTAGVAINLLENTHNLPNSVPVGKAMVNNDIYIFDRYFTPVPQGVVGEIHIGGKELARGYYNDPARTAYKFVPHPFRKGEVLFRTGDIGFVNKDGQIEVLGRCDSQIKVRGYRVDPVEIEIAIRNSNMVYDVAIVYVDQVLKAYIITKQNFSLSQLSQDLRNCLPEYMLPQKYFRISQLPKTLSGKTNYKVLRSFDRDYVFGLGWQELQQTHCIEATEKYLFFSPDFSVKNEAVCVRHRGDFIQGDHEIHMDFTKKQHYDQLVVAIKQFKITTIIYTQLQGDLQPFIHLLQSLGAQIETMRIVVVTRNVFCVKSREKISPDNAIAIGALRAVAAEYPGMQYCCIDFDDETERVYERICNELGLELLGNNIAYRNNKRYVQVFQSVNAQSSTQMIGRVYLITGGLGSVGREIGIFLAENTKGSIAITTRCKNNMDDDARQYIEKLRGLGAHVVVYETSIQDVDELQNIKKHIEQNLGKIDGVFHCAGIRGCFQTLANTNYCDLHIALQHEENMCKALFATFAKQPPQFVMLFSSLSSIYGRLAQVAYCAINAYLDSVAHQYTQQGLNTIAVNWDVWKELPLAVPSDAVSEIATLMRHDSTKGITNNEAIQILPLLSSGMYQQFVVSHRVLRDQYNVTPISFLAQDSHPQTPLQHKLCSIWQEVLQVDKVYIDDNFFQLGGHSLLAIILVEKIRNMIGIEKDDHEGLPLSILLTHPTIAQLSDAISSLHSALQEQVIQMNSTVEGKISIFLVHGPRVDPICYQHLAKSLDGILTVYAIRSSELAFDTSIVDTARYHMQKIKSVQENGPYVIGGMCLGGLIAFEVAQQISSAGGNVALTFIMDLINVPGMENYKSQSLHQKKKRRPKKRLYKTIRHLLVGDMHFMWQKIQKIKRNLSIKRKINKLTDPRVKLRKEMRNRLRRIRDQYSPQDFDGRLLFVRSEKQRGDFAEQRLRELAKKEFFCHQIKGTIHSDVTRGYFASVTAKYIEKYLFQD